LIPVLKRRGWRPRVIAYDGYGSARPEHWRTNWPEPDQAAYTQSPRRTGAAADHDLGVAQAT